jgi:predicted GNAT family acetyltransferase
MGLFDKLRPPPPPEIVDEPDAGRFTIKVEGRRAGYATYRRHDGTITFRHTEIDPEFEGQGLGGQLVKAALAHARDEGASVIPVCPFVREYIARHPDWLDLVPADRRKEFELPRN